MNYNPIERVLVLASALVTKWRPFAFGSRRHMLTLPVLTLASPKVRVQRLGGPALFRREVPRAL